MVLNNHKLSKSDPTYKGPFVIEAVTKRGSYSLRDHNLPKDEPHLPYVVPPQQVKATNMVTLPAPGSVLDGYHRRGAEEIITFRAPDGSKRHMLMRFAPLSESDRALAATLRDAYNNSPDAERNRVNPRPLWS